MIVSSNWCSTKYEAWKQFNIEYAWVIKTTQEEVLEWVKEPVVIEENGKFRVEGVAQ